MSTAVQRPASSSIPTLGAVIFSAGAVATGISLGLPLLALVMEARGFSGTWIGLNTATAGLASLLAPLAAPFLTRRFGTVPTLTTSLATAAISFYAFHLISELAGWFALRMVFHGALTIAFIMSEVWIVGAAPAR